jgi:hypothetical protein
MTKLLTLGSQANLEELLLPKLVKTFHVFYGTQMFVTVLTRVLSLC